MPLLPAAERVGFGWSFEPGVVIPLIVVGAVYARGAYVMRVRSSHAPRATAIAAFAGGWATLVVGLVSPVDGISEQLFSMHMVQHELLMALAAPLLVASRPGPALVWAFGSGSRPVLVRLLRAPLVRRTWRALTQPFTAWLAQTVVIWLWHAPPLFEAALHSDLIHAIQHLAFLGSAVAFWWSIMHGRREARGLAIVSLFTTAVHTGVLGALMTFARSPWYPAYGAGPEAWGLTLIGDQQLAGLIMWIPASAAYLVATLSTAYRWLHDSEWEVVERERAALAPLGR
ncbi:MAG TPA: cytochrome c oxidase assembly protein [Gemmatimonadaceae bacterium]|nr:cytochrome c oxidase assembly protein [Gemmatimonadaceae bacterium]